MDEQRTDGMINPESGTQDLSKIMEAAEIKIEEQPIAPQAPNAQYQSPVPQASAPAQPVMPQAPSVPQASVPQAVPLYQSPYPPVYRAVQTPYYQPVQQAPAQPVPMQPIMPQYQTPPMYMTQPVYMPPVVPDSLLPKDYTPADPPSFEAAEEPEVSSGIKLPVGEDTSSIDLGAVSEEPLMQGDLSLSINNGTTESHVSARAMAGNSGLRVFCVMLAFVVVICSCLAAGYYMGKDSVQHMPGYQGNAIDIMPRPDNDSLMSIAGVSQKVSKSVVSIITYSPDGGSMSNATGIVLNTDGYILTNDHVCASIPGSKFMLTLYDGREVEAAFFAGDARSDIAILKCDTKDLTPAEFGDSNSVVAGEQVVALGYPSTPSVLSTTNGIISAVNRRVANSSSNYSMRLLQTNAAINPGSSGGPLCNMYGQVIGINSSKIISTGVEGVGFSIPSVMAKSVADSLIKNKFVADRAKLGITYVFNDSLSAGINEMPVGLVLESVSGESAFGGTKVKKDDILIEMNGKKIISADMVLDAVEGGKPDDSVQFTVFRPENNETFTVAAKLIADQGKTARSETPVSSNSDTSSNGGDFDFPFGE